MKLSDIADMREYLDNRCYCPGEIYDSYGFFYQVFDPDTECKIICTGIRNEIHEKFVIAQANEKTKSQIIYIQISDGTVKDCMRFDATDNNIKLIKEFMAGKYKRVFLDEYKETDTEKTLQEVFSISERSSLQESSPRSVLAWGEKSAGRLRLVRGSRWNRGLRMAEYLPWASIAKANLAPRHL